jgi:hypothetical protein
MSKVRSYDEYRSRIQQLLGELVPAEATAFLAWSLGRFPEEFGEQVWDGLTQVERAWLEGVVAEVQSQAGSAPHVANVRAADLQRQVERLGPSDPVAATEVHPDAVEFRSAIWQALEFCRGLEVAALCAVSERFINVWDSRADPADGSYLNENMFTYPALAAELTRQEEYLASLRRGRRTRG